MKIGLMQPYFFPYLGQFQIINAVDRFILVDELQYIKAGWIHRNRILKPNSGWQYIILQTGALKMPLSTIIKDVYAIDSVEWKEKILAQMSLYKKIAPYYRIVCELVKECFTSSERNIARLNGLYMKTVCDYIGIDFKVEISSDMHFDYSRVTNREERAIEMCKQLQASEMINPPGGITLYDKNNFRKEGIVLNFLQPIIKEYNQNREVFEPGLSIIDVMMFNSPADIKLMLQDYQLL